MSLLCGSAAFAQSSSVATNPVGFISITVAPGSQSSPVLTMVSPTLTNPIAFQSTVASVSGTTITITGASFTADQFDGANGSFYVEDLASSQAGSGVLADITATGSNSVTTSQNISALITAGDTIIIRQHITLNQFLGATNTYGLLGSTVPNSADQVIVYDGATHVSYFYYNGTQGPNGWYDTSFNPAGAVTIAPFQGVVIQRRGTTPLTIVSTGTVKTNNTLFPVSAGVNVLGTVSAQGLTLATSGLYTGTSSGVTGSTVPNSADHVSIYTSTTSSTSHTDYFYYNGNQGPVGWYDTSFNPAGSVSIPPGSSFVVTHSFGAPFNWPLPSPSSF